MTSPQDDVVLYGGGHVEATVSEEGMGEQYIAQYIMLTNEFDLNLVKPGEIDPDQTEPAYMVTFKGRANNSKELSSVTLIFDVACGRALMKTLALKYSQLPIQFR